MIRGKHEKRNNYTSLQPIYTEDSLILILGSLPSKKSREENFYYANPKNRFWSVLSQIFQETPKTKEEKITFLKKHRLALWMSFIHVI